MAYEAFLNDLRFAQQAGKAVRVSILNGRDLGLVGVHEVDENGRWVSLFTPRTFGDDTSRTRVDADSLLSVEVTEINWS